MRYFSKSGLILTASFLGMSIFPSVSFADDLSGSYINIGVTQLSTDLDLTQLDISGETVDLGNQSLDITMLTGRLGYRLNSFLAVEGEVGLGLGGDSFNETVPVSVEGLNLNVDTNVDLNVDSYAIGFAKTILPLSEQFEVFGRLGYGRATAEANITASVSGFTGSASDSQSADGVAYGVGAQYNFTSRDGVRADFTKLEETNIFSVSYARRF